MDDSVQRKQISAGKMYTYIRGYANGRKMSQTLKALSFAREKHSGQKKKSGEPYIIHPLTMACHALALGIDDDETIATILLHDVCEDCGVVLSELPVGEEVRRAVDLITFRKMDDETDDAAIIRYYNMMLQSKSATYAKLVDRCHNVSSMAGVFSVPKLKSYVEETRRFVLPLLKKAKLRWADDTDALFVLKYHITSVIDAIDEAIRVLEASGK